MGFLVLLLGFLAVNRQPVSQCRLTVGQLAGAVEAGCHLSVLVSVPSCQTVTPPPACHSLQQLASRDGAAAVGVPRACRLLMPDAICNVGGRWVRRRQRTGPLRHSYGAQLATALGCACHVTGQSRTVFVCGFPIPKCARRGTIVKAARRAFTAGQQGLLAPVALTALPPHCFGPAV